MEPTEPAFAKCCCEHCENHIEFPVGAAGTRVACPHCGGTTSLAAAAPEPSPAAVAEAGSLLDPEIHVPAPPVTTGYRLGLALVAFMMVLMPLVYVAMVVMLLGGLIAYAVWLLPVIQSGAGTLRWLRYVAPLGFGAAVAVFMIRPLFARRIARAQALALNPETEPMLGEFIARVCRAVGAPSPLRIELTCELNAAARLEGGSFSGQGLVLTLGLPLVAGLSRRQLAGVLAHEFGHFTQTSGMRYYRIIRTIHLWFARLVQEPTSWGASFEEGLAGGTPDLFAGVTHLLIGITRLPLRLVMFCGQVVSAYFSRQMEFDADRYEIHLAGSALFEATLLRLRTLGRALRRSYEVMHSSWVRNRKLPDNLPAFLLEQEAQLPATLRAKLERGLAEETQGLFATHPSDAERVRRARALKLPGLLQGDGPSSSLFANFEAVARQVTLLHYTEDLGLPTLSGVLTPVGGAVPAHARAG